MHRLGPQHGNPNNKHLERTSNIIIAVAFLAAFFLLIKIRSDFRHLSGILVKKSERMILGAFFRIWKLTILIPNTVFSLP
jgi:hypothetical protein